MNSVKPPVRFCTSRLRTMCRSQDLGPSTDPCMIFLTVGTGLALTVRGYLSTTSSWDRFVRGPSRCPPPFAACGFDPAAGK